MRRVSIGSPRDKNGIFSGNNRRSSLPGQMSVNRIHSSKCSNTLERDISARNGPLPRVRRMNDSEFGSTSVSKNALASSPLYSPMANKNMPVIHAGKMQVSSPRRYPTHQPQFSGLGVLPSVRLNKSTRAVLSEQNSTMLNNSVTVKVAPPDVLKAPTPVFVQVSSKNQETQPKTSSCDPESVLSALREKRKRNLGEDEGCLPLSPDSKQVTKRRRHLQDEEVNGDTTKVQVSEGADQEKITNKRPATSDEDLNDESQKRLKSERKRAVGVKNALEASFSSSKRWMEKSRDLLNRSRDSSLSRSRRSFSAEPYMFSQQSSRNTSLSNTPRHSITLEEDVVMTTEMGNLSNTSTPIPGTSGRTTPLTDGDHSDCLSASMLATPKNKPLVLKEGSTKRRLMPSSTSNEDYATVPRLRYQLTSEDFEKDRRTDIDRVKQLMNDVDEEYHKQNEKNKSILTSKSVATVAEATCSQVQPVTATSAINQPIVVGFALQTSTAAKPAISIAPVSSLKAENSSQGTTTSSNSMVASVNPNSTSLSTGLAATKSQASTVTSVSDKPGMQPSATELAGSNACGLASTASSIFVQPRIVSSLTGQSGMLPSSGTNLASAVTLATTGTNNVQPSGLKTTLNEKQESTASPGFSLTSGTVSQNLPTTTSVGAGAQSAELKFKPIFGVPTQTADTSLSSSSTQNAIGGFKFNGTVGVSSTPVSSGSSFSFGGSTTMTATVSSTSNTSNGSVSLMGAKTDASAGFNFGAPAAGTAAFAAPLQSTFSAPKSANVSSALPKSGFSFTAGSGSCNLVSSTVTSGAMLPQATKTDSALNLTKPKTDNQTTGMFNFGQKAESTPKAPASNFSTFGTGAKTEPFGTSSNLTNTSMFGAGNKPSQTQNAPFQFGNSNTAQSTVVNNAPSSSSGIFSFGTQNKSENKPVTFGTSTAGQQQASKAPTFGQPSSTSSVSGSFGAPSSNTAGGFGATFGGTASTSNQPAAGAPFSFGAKSPSSNAAPGFGTPRPPAPAQQNGFGGGPQQAPGQNKGFNFAPSAGNSSFNFGQSPAAPVQFGSPTPSFGAQPNSNVFNVASSSTAPRQRTIKAATRRKPVKR